MDLEELLVDGTLYQDDWSLSGPVFGSLKVVGWSGKRKGDKFYILHCTECEKDPGLHGGGYFKSLKFSLTRNKPQIPCGCAIHVHWTEKQYTVLAKRKLDRLGIKFLGWAEPYRRADTKVKLECPLHGEWVGTNVGNLAIQTTDKGNCKKCGDISGTETRTKDPTYFIDSFMQSGKFEVGTTFEYIGNRGETTARMWRVNCSRCGCTFESSSGSLQAGKVGCGCSWGFNQKEAYINNVFYGDVLVGLKFGISVNANERNRTINKNTEFTVRLANVYKFDSVGDCRNAEKACKKELPCVIFSKQSLPDGYTETTYPHYCENITKIYESFGGKPVDIAQTTA